MVSGSQEAQNERWGRGGVGLEPVKCPSNREGKLVTVSEPQRGLSARAVINGEPVG